MHSSVGRILEHPNKSTRVSPLCVRVCACIWACVSVRASVYTCVHVCTCVHVYVRACVRTCVCYVIFLVSEDRRAFIFRDFLGDLVTKKSKR